jgi:hypothetical protein
VDVDVDSRRVDLEEKDIEGQRVRGEQSSEPVADGAVQRGVADEAPVDEEELLAARLAGEGRFADEAGDAYDIRVLVDGHEALVVAGAEDAEDAGARGAGAQVVQLLAVRGQREGDVRVGQSDPLEFIEAVPQLDRIRFEEGPARRDVEEQVADGDGGAGGCRQGLGTGSVAALGLDAGADGIAGPAGAEVHPRHRRDGGEGFAAEPFREEGEQVVGVAELRGGVALEAADRVRRGHAGTGVDYVDQGAAGIREVDVDACGTGIDRILDEFLDDAGGALDHFAGGDLVRNMRWQHLDEALLAHLRKPFSMPPKSVASTHCNPLIPSQINPKIISNARSRA